MTTPNPYLKRRVRAEVRDARLQRISYRSYKAYLASPRWADKRAEYRASDLPQDCFCGETEHLQLHHLTYERVGCEDLADLTPICATCHAMVHALEVRGVIELDFTGFVNEQRAAKRRAEVEEAEREKQIGKLEDQAFVEDIRRRCQALVVMAKEADIGCLNAVAAVRIAKKMERHLERVHSFS